MNLIPWPELVVASAVGSILIAARAPWNRRPLPVERAQGNARLSGSGRSPEQIRVRLMASCVLLVIISVPLILEIVPPNGIYGFRVSGTRSPAIWYPANAFMGWALLVAASVGATLQVVLPPTFGRWLLWAAFLVPILGAVVASFMYLSELLNAV